MATTTLDEAYVWKRKKFRTSAIMKNRNKIKSKRKLLQFDIFNIAIIFKEY